MQKLHQKQIQKLRQQQRIIQEKYNSLLNDMINNNQQLKQIILFSKDTFQSSLKINQQKQQSSNNLLSTYSLSDFTPASISKLVFQSHLIKIKQEFNRLPHSQAKLQHFILIMMKVIFVDPSLLLQKQKQQQIMTNIVKQNYIKSGLKPQSPNKKLSSPNKLKPPPILSNKQQLNNKHTNKLQKQQRFQPYSLQFDRYPYYIIALNYMYKQIVLPSHQSITFSQLQKFIMGQLITMSKPISNTEFTIQFQQTKKQDFLLHDNGIKRLAFCKTLNIYLCLDIKQNIIKIYTSQLKNKQNFTPNRQKHNRKLPQVLDMFYSDFNNSLGLLLSNKSIQIINFQAFMTKLYEKQFLPFNMNQIVIKFENPLKRIFFLQMFNKWLIVGIKNQLILCDVSKYRSKDEQLIITSLKNQKQQLNITNVLQVISLSAVCVVAGNQLWFYDEKMSKRKYQTYVHQLNISIVKYYEQKNAFYLCGYKQKVLTILKPQRGRQNMQIHSINFSRPIMDFEVFSIYNSIVLIDDKHTVRLVSEQSKQMYQMQQYGRIVKQQMINNDNEEGKRINILKLNKQHFIISQSYMVSLSLAKVPIQTQIQFEFLPYNYFDPIKQDIYISFNNQILCISLLQGQIRQSLTLDNSNMQTPCYFFHGSPKWKPFMLDIQGKIFDLSIQELQGNLQSDSKKYKKKLQIKNVQWCTFDQSIGRFLSLSNQQLYQVKNQRQNTFSTVNVTNFRNCQILSSTYIQSRKQLFLACISSINQKQQQLASSKLNLNISSSSKLFKSNSSNKSLIQIEKQNKQIIQQQFFIQFNISQPLCYNVIKFKFRKITSSDKPQLILKCQYIDQYNVAVLLNDQNVIYLVDVSNKSTINSNINKAEQQQQNTRRFICIKVYHYIAPKVRDLLKFNELYINILKIKDISQKDQKVGKKIKEYKSIFLTSEQGFFIQIRLNNILSKYFKQSQLRNIQKHSTNTLSQLCEIDYNKFKDNQVQQIILDKNNPFYFNNIQEEFSLIKAHNSCKIQIIKKIFIQFIFTLTIATDGYLKLWNQNKQCIISLKLPTLRKQVFETKKIQDIRGRRMMQQAYFIVKRINQQINHKHKLKQILHITRHHDFDKTYQKIDQKQPIKIDIQNKSIQQIIIQQPAYQTIIDAASSIMKRFKHRYIEQKQDNKNKKITSMSLKKQKSFQTLMQKSRLQQKNSMTIPVELLQLRKPLKRYQRKYAKSIDITGLSDRLNQPKHQLLILPKLKQYKMQTRSGKRGNITQRQYIKKQLIDDQPTEYDSFEACAFVKNKIEHKKANQLDRIDKQFIRKQYSLAVKKHLAKKKDAVQITNNKMQHQQKIQIDQDDISVSLQTILSDMKRIKHQSKYGGDRFIPKVKFKSFSQLN